MIRVRFLLAALSLCAAVCAAAERPLIFPIPQKMEVPQERFVLEETVPILVPVAKPAPDMTLARFLVAELSDRYGLALRIEPVAQLPAGRRFILMGSSANPLVRAFARSRSWELSRQRPGPEGYFLHAGSEAMVVAGSDDAGAFYGLQSVRQLIRREGRVTHIRGADVEDKPHLPFRAIRLYLPGRENIAFYKRFVRDFMALYKFNKVVMEVNASMRLDRHPEMNAGWIDFAKELFYSQRYHPRGPHQVQNSAHHDTADGEILEKEEVADLVKYSAAMHVEMIPEIPTLTHSYYLLTRHKRFGAVTGAEWPDTYCPTDPDIYQLVFDVMDEYVGVMRPSMVHIGHDEMFFPLELCRCCQGKDMSELFAYDVKRIYDYLTRKRIKVAMYGDHLIESVRGAGKKPVKSSTGWQYHMPGALTPQQVKDLIPKDILIFNWFWQDVRAAEGRGEPNDVKLHEWGFQQVHNNFTPFVEHYGRRSARSSVIGGVPSSWSATNEYTFGKDMMLAYLGTANLMWSTHWPDTKELTGIVQSLMPEVRRTLGGKWVPSEDGDAVIPVDLSPHVNSSSWRADFGVDLSNLKAGLVEAGNKRFAVPAGGAVIAGTQGEGGSVQPRQSGAIPVGADASSILFLHATARGAANDMSYRYIHNFPDTSDLLGWYEVVYEDGFVATIPIRFGVNILPLGWGRQPDTVAKGNAREFSYAYQAEVIPSGSATLFAYEWVNPRFGKTVKEIRLHGTTGFTNTRGAVTPSNAIVLAGLSLVKKRPIPSP